MRGNLESGSTSRPGRYSGEDALLAGETPGGAEGLVVGYGHRLVDERDVDVVRDETRADSLDLVRARLATGKDRRICRLDRDDPRLRAEFPPHPPDTGESASGPHAGDKDVHCAVGVRHSSRASWWFVDLGVGRVRKLLRFDRVGNFGRQLRGARAGTLHALRGGCEHDFGTEKIEDLSPLDRHRFRHGQYAAIASRCRHHGQGDAGVARGGLDDGGHAGLNPALTFEGVHHGHPEPVLDRVRRIEELEFGDDLGGNVCGQCDSNGPMGYCPSDRVMSDAIFIFPPHGVSGS